MTAPAVVLGPAARVALAFARRPSGDPRWTDRAACRGVNPELFWPPSGEPADQALALCMRCPVLGDCRELFASQPHDEGGVWFATTADERAAETARQARRAG